MDEVKLPSNTNIVEDEDSLALCKKAQEMGQAEEMELHPLCKVFPPMPDEELKDLAEDIGARGQREPIITLDNMILDGGNRYKACRLAGVEPWLEEYKGDQTPEDFVVSKNLKRRNLKPSQKAMVVAELEKLRHGGNRQGAKAEGATSRKKLARVMGVCPRLVASAKVVKEKGSPDLIEAVRRGEKSASQAEAEIKKAAGGGKAKATAEDAANKVTGEPTKTTDKPSERGPSVTEEQAARQLIDWLVELCPPGQWAELAELAEEAGPMWRDLATRLRQAEAEADQRDGAKAA